MIRRRSQSRGFSLLEVMISTVVFMIGTLGVIGSLIEARGATSVARRVMLANAVVTDLAEQIATWDYDDPRLSTAAAAPCSTDPADLAQALAAHGSSDFSTFAGCAHGETDLTLSASLWGGLPTSADTEGVRFESDLNEDDYQRFWVVREEDRDGNAIPAASANTGVRKRVWVYATYSEKGTGRRVVGFAAKFRPGGL